MLDEELERGVTAVLQARADDASQPFDPESVVEAAINGAAARAHRRRLTWVMATAAAVAVTLAIGFLNRNAVADAPQPTSTQSPSATSRPSPSASEHEEPPVGTRFLRPFTYVLPPGRHIHVVEDGGNLLGFFEADLEPPPEQAGNVYAPDGSGAVQTGAHGVVVAVVEEPVTHECPAGPERFVPMRATPAEFLEDLRDIADIPVSNVTPTTIDGRPALSATVRHEPSCAARDFHVKPYTGVMASPWVRLDLPSRLFVLEVEGLTVVVQIWAPTEPDLTTWADEAANEFVRSIDFEAP